MIRKLLPLVLLALGGACRAPSTPAPVLVEKPGWGRLTTRANTELSVRAVPASARPSLPPTRHGKPGWGRE